MEMWPARSTRQTEPVRRQLGAKIRQSDRRGGDRGWSVIERRRHPWNGRVRTGRRQEAAMRASMRSAFVARPSRRWGSIGEEVRRTPSGWRGEARIAEREWRRPTGGMWVADDGISDQGRAQDVEDVPWTRSSSAASRRPHGASRRVEEPECGQDLRGTRTDPPNGIRPGCLHNTSAASAPRHVRRYGRALRFDLSAGLDGLTRDEAVLAEAQLGDRLRAAGYCVYGAH